MKQPTADYILKEFLTLVNPEKYRTIIQALLDRYHLIDKTEPIHGAVSSKQFDKWVNDIYENMEKDTMVDHCDIHEQSAYKALDLIPKSFDIYHKGTVSRLQAEVERLKGEIVEASAKVLETHGNLPETAKVVREEAKAKRVQLPEVRWLEGTRDLEWFAETSRFMQAVKRHLEGGE